MGSGPQTIRAASRIRFNKTPAPTPLWTLRSPNETVIWLVFTGNGVWAVADWPTATNAIVAMAKTSGRFILSSWVASNDFRATQQDLALKCEFISRGRSQFRADATALVTKFSRSRAKPTERHV